MRRTYYMLRTKGNERQKKTQNFQIFTRTMDKRTAQLRNNSLLDQTTHIEPHCIEQEVTKLILFLDKKKIEI